MNLQYVKLLVVAPFLLFCACGGGSGSSEDDTTTEEAVDTLADELIEESNSSREGRYAYVTSPTTMSCSDGETIDLPAVSDTGTLRVDGDSFTFTLDIESSVPTSDGSTSSSECVFTDDDSFTCSGMYSDDMTSTTFNGGGMFSETGFSGWDDLVMTLDSGVVCSWTQNYSAEKIADL